MQGISESASPVIKRNPEEITKRKACGYIRVDTDNEASTSFEMQKKYYTTYIDKCDWELIDIYSDKTGSATENGYNFNRMIADAENGNIDVIVTKSVSRFAVNLITSVETAQRLLALPKPVEIVFEVENLSTFRIDCEYILSIILLIAYAAKEVILDAGNE